MSIRLTSRMLAAAAVVAFTGPIGLRADAARWWTHVEALANDGLAGRNTGRRRQARGRVHRGTVSARRARAGRQPRLPAADRVQDPADRRIAIEPGAGAGRQERAADARRRRQHQHARSIRRSPSTRRSCLPATGCTCPSRHQRPAGARSAGSGGGLPGRGAGGLPGPLQAHVGSAAERWKVLKAAGAIGTIGIANPKTLEIPWARSTLARLQAQMSLADPALDEAAGLRLSVTMNPAHADKLFAGSGHTFAEVLALADGGRPLPGFALPARIKAVVRVERVKWGRRMSPASCADRIRCGATSGRPVGAPGSSRRRRSADQRRRASTTVRWTTRRASPR